MAEATKEVQRFGTEPGRTYLPGHAGAFYRLVEQFYPNVRVLSFNEIANNVQIQSIGGLRLEAPVGRRV